MALADCRPGSPVSRGLMQGGRGLVCLYPELGDTNYCYHSRWLSNFTTVSLRLIVCVCANPSYTTIGVSRPNLGRTCPALSTDVPLSRSHSPMSRF